MTRRADPIWRVLAERPGTAGTLLDWRDLLGDALELARPLLVPTGATASAWVCGDRGREGCHRRVVDHGDVVVAVCREQPRRCDRVVLPRQDLVLYRLDARRLGSALLKGAVEVQGSPQAMGRGWLLGTAHIGQAEVVFHLGFDARVSALLGIRRALLERWPQRFVVLLVPEADQLDAVARTELLERDALVLPLDEAMRGDNQLVLDLADVITHFRFDGVDLGAHLAHRYDLILDPLGGAYWLFGQRIAFKQRARFPPRLLVALAKTPSSLVTRAALFGEVWPDEYYGASEKKDWNRALRDVVAKLKATLAIDEERYPITAHRSGDDAEGGYMLRIDPRRVYWWSRPLD